jgi:hypothetical protein
VTYRDGAEERRGLLAPIEVDIGVASDSQFYADLSGRIVGVFAATMQVAPNGSRIELVVSIPNSGSFRATGVVQFVRASADDQLPGLGIAFTTIERADYELAAAFCGAFRAPMFYDE